MAHNTQLVVPSIVWNSDQLAAQKIARSDSTTYHLFRGGGGSGKSFLILYIIIARAMRYPKSRHAVFRLTRNSCDTSLFSKTLYEVLALWPGLLGSQSCQISLSDMTVTFANGSLIQFDGLDDNRITKVLGNEYNTIWINECNETGLTYRQVSTLDSRLRYKAFDDAGKPIKNKMFFDCNPRWRSDWEYQAFMLGINPIDRNAFDNVDEWVTCKLDPLANIANLDAEALERQKRTMTAQDRRRYIDGEWSDENTSALFNETNISKYRVPVARDVGPNPEDILDYLADYQDDNIRNVRIDRINIACDPAKSNDTKSDLHGITVQASGTVWNIKEGMDEQHAFVLADHSMRASPNAVCELIKELYYRWNAQRIVIESNAAGSWLVSMMRTVFPAAPLKMIAATSTTGNKSDRAEPVAAQYERGAVHHVGSLKDLEQQMCDWGSPASRRKSPDRMDAVVWGITDLLDLAHEKRTATGGGIARRGNKRR